MSDTPKYKFKLPDAEPEAPKPEPVTDAERKVLEDLAQRVHAKEAELEAKRIRLQKRMGKRKGVMGKAWNEECQARGRRRKAKKHRRRMARR